jgi:predicted dienelactone hydrolase
MSKYDPFNRGPHPVGTRQFSWTDEARNHTMPVDVWYPATENYQGQDLAPETQASFEMIPGMGMTLQQAVENADPRSDCSPLVVFSHGFGGERRQSTFLYTHLASHGYVVASMDHVGNTTADMLSGEGAAGDADVIDRFIQSRPLDASFVIDAMLSGQSGLNIDSERIGMAGHSFGGWTTLKTLENDARIKAALPLAPAGGMTRLDPTNVMATSLNFQFKRSVPTLLIVADLDSILPLEGMQDLHARHPGPRSTVVLQNADHFHFNDAIEQTHDGYQMMLAGMAEGMEAEARQGLEEILAKMKPSSELVPGDHAYRLINGLGLTHFDAELREDPSAIAMMRSNLVETAADQGILIELL